ncbi:cation transporter [Primorskyibacter sp. S87]|uniref:cation transporter n=1 Tax=Primorskyibacter sp. S87 TaxID=3415126 RepID=UPI003C7DE2A7
MTEGTAPLTPAELKAREGRSLVIGMVSNLFMGAAGITAALLSNSNAVMVDGLFSLIGFFAAWFGRQIGQRADLGPDRLRPMGYAAEESIFSTFRSLSLLGLVLFAVFGAIQNITRYLNGDPPPELVYEPLFVYFAVVSLTCLATWFVHHRNWKNTGKVSDILRLEAKAAAFDGFITLAAGIGLIGIHFFREGFLAPIAPIGDSIIVLGLCLTAVGQYYRDFITGLGELAGATASPEALVKARRALRPVLAEQDGTVQDISVVKVGRSFLVTVYFTPSSPVSAEQIDRLNLSLIAAAQTVLNNADVILIMSQYGRRWPEELDPSR